MVANEYSIKKRLRFFLSLVIVPCSLFIITLGITSFAFFDRQNKQVEVYGNLTSVYSNARTMHESAKNYVVSNSISDYEAYANWKQQAEKSICDITSTLPSSSSKLELLENMFFTYDELVMRKPNPKDKEFIPFYEDLNYTSQLIQNTYTSFGNYINSLVKQENRQAFKNGVGLLIFLVVLLAVFIIYSYILMRTLFFNITNPVSTMVENLDSIKKGHYDMKANDTTILEYQEVSKAIRALSLAIQENLNHFQEETDLRNRILEQENEKLRVLKDLSETKLTSLQMQINPHFLYNTLAMISQYSYLKGYEGVKTLLDSLASLIQYGLEYSTKKSTLFKEIENTRNYINIQKMRFADRITFILDDEEYLPNVEIPALILQPLIENSVKHGVKGMLEGAEITTTIHMNGEDLCMSVEDNGCGIEPDELDQILIGLGSPKNASHGIGIWNVYRRLDSYFKQNLSFNIESSEGCGTSILIRLSHITGSSHV